MPPADNWIFDWRGRIVSAFLHVLFVLAIAMFVANLGLEFSSTEVWVRFIRVLMVNAVIVGVCVKPFIAVDAIIKAMALLILVFLATCWVQICLSYLVNGWGLYPP